MVKSWFSAQLDFVQNTQSNDLELMTKFFDQFVNSNQLIYTWLPV